MRSISRVTGGSGVSAGRRRMPPAPDTASARRQICRTLRDNAPAGSLSRMTLEHRCAERRSGSYHRRSAWCNSVGTQINTDSANAERLALAHGGPAGRARASRAGERKCAHHRDGDASDATDPARQVVAGDRDGLRLNAAQQSGSANDGAAMNQGQRERAANAREWDRPETSRQSRDEQRESARQGAGQRGQREYVQRERLHDFSSTQRQQL